MHVLFVMLTITNIDKCLHKVLLNGRYIGAFISLDADKLHGIIKFGCMRAFFYAGPSRAGTGPRGQGYIVLSGPINGPHWNGCGRYKHRTRVNYIAFVYWVINYPFIVSSCCEN